MKNHTFLLGIILNVICLSFLLSNHLPQVVNAKGKSDLIPGQYIVVFKDSVTNPEAVANEHARSRGLSLGHTYKSIIKGYSAALSESQLEKLKLDPRVDFISQDRVVSIEARRPPKPSPTPTTAPSQTTPIGITRIGINSSYLGTGIGVAVIDTGINLSHPDLAANIIANKTCVLGTVNGNDDNGHGSHVAGTIAALDNNIGVVGVAPQVKLAAVKVLDRNGSGTWSSVICGIDWVTANAIKYNLKVANMSLSGGGVSDNNCGNSNADALHKAICNSTAKGVTYVVAAGNANVDASNSVPASYNDTVITVSALADSDGLAGGLGPATSYGPDDTFASFSNYGTVVDLGAPGVNIYSTWKNGGYNTISGTSMATPHVAGVAALYHQAHPGSTWSQVRDALVASGEALNSGHTDPSSRHPEPIVKVSSF